MRTSLLLALVLLAGATTCSLLGCPRRAPSNPGPTPASPSSASKAGASPSRAVVSNDSARVDPRDVPERIAATGHAGVASLELDDDEIFGLAFREGRFDAIAVPKKGGPPRELLGPSGGFGYGWQVELALQGKDAFLSTSFCTEIPAQGISCGSVLSVVSKRGGESSLDRYPLATAGGNVVRRGLAVDGTHVYWLERKLPYGSETLLGSGERLARAPLAGGKGALFGPKLSRGFDLVTVGGFAYVADAPVAGTGRVVRVALKDGIATDFASGLDDLGALATNGAALFWHAGADARLETLAFDAPPKTPPRVLARDVEHSAVGASDVYFTRDDGLYRVPLDGSSAPVRRIELEGHRVGGLAADATNLYYSYDGDLMRLAR
jgi:hypothetical protein